MKLVSLFARPLGVDSTPFGHSEKSIASAIIAGVAAIASSVIASAANSSSVSSTNAANLQAQADTNATNKEIAREANEMSQAQFDSNMQWSREQFYKQREYALDDRAYNDPSAIVQRLKQAGINPAAAFGQGSTSTPSVGSVGLPSQSSFQAGYAQAPHSEPFIISDGLSESVGHAIDAYYQNRLIDAQRSKTEHEAGIARVQEVFAFQKEIAYLRNQYVDIEEKLSRRDLNKEQRTYFENQSQMIKEEINEMHKTFSERLRQLQSSNALTERQTSHYDAVESSMADESARGWATIQINRQLAESGISLNAINGALMQAQTGEVKSRTALNEQEKIYNQKVERLRILRERAIGEQEKWNAVGSHWNAIDASKNPRQQVGTNRAMRDYIDYARDFEDWTKKNAKKLGRFLK